MSDPRFSERLAFTNIFDNRASVNSRRYNPRKTQRFNAGQGRSLEKASRSDMTPITRKHELSYPHEARGVEVVYTTEASEAERWLRDHIIDCSTEVVGFDMEWKPQYVSKKHGGIQNETAVLQLGVETSCLVLHIYHMSTLPKALVSILGDENIIKVGSGINQDGLKLKKDRGLALKGLADNQLMVKQLDPASKKIGMKALAKRFLGVELDKSVAKSNWEKFPLKLCQIEYAAKDAWVGLKIFQEMKRQMRSQVTKTETPVASMLYLCIMCMIICVLLGNPLYLFMFIIIIYASCLGSS